MSPRPSPADPPFPSEIHAEVSTVHSLLFILTLLIRPPLTDMHDTAYTFFSGLGSVLILLPITFQWRARNTSTIFNLLWIFVIDLVVFVNSIMWWDNYRVYGLVWGDISTFLVCSKSLTMQVPK